MVSRSQDNFLSNIYFNAYLTEGMSNFVGGGGGGETVAIFHLFRYFIKVIGP